jgi:hypothetical protein
VTDDLEKQLRELDEAFRASAKANGWREPDTSAAGLIPEEEIQSLAEGLEGLTDEERDELVMGDFEFDRLPADARFIGWASKTVVGTEVVVTAKVEEGEPVELGRWHLDVIRELVRRYREASGG